MAALEPLLFAFTTKLTQMVNFPTGMTFTRVT